MPVSKSGGDEHLVLVTEDRPRDSTPCVKVSKLRSAGVFDDWCCKHHHWLNGAPAMSVVESSELGICRSAFPAPAAEFSQLHTSAEDAVEHIREAADEHVAVTVLP